MSKVCLDFTIDTSSIVLKYRPKRFIKSCQRVLQNFDIQIHLYLTHKHNTQIKTWTNFFTQLGSDFLMKKIVLLLIRSDFKT